MIKQQRNTDCSFEANYDWMSILRNKFKIENLVDDDGDIVQ